MRQMLSRGIVTVAALVLVVAGAARGQPPADGQAAFDRICATCHGPKGAGDVGPRLVPFTRGNRELLGIVRDGTGQMPAISERDISDEEVVAVADYLRSLTAETGRRVRPEITNRR
jgi:mono/diheme cytochrome c family protein